MYYVKRYGILIDNPKLNMDTFRNIVSKIISLNLIPIVVLQDGSRVNSFLTIKNKIDMLTNWFPNEIREDNILIIGKEFNFMLDRNKWSLELKRVVNKINVRAFGTTDQGTNDKLFIVNLNNHIMVLNRYLYIDNHLDSMIKELFNIADILNIKSFLDDKVKIFDPYINYLFRDRTYDEIYYDDSKGKIFYANINANMDNKAYIILEDAKYIELMKKYDLGKLLYSSYKSELKVEDSDIEAITKFLSKNDITYTFETYDKPEHNFDKNKKKIIIDGVNISKNLSAYNGQNFSLEI